MKNFRYIVLILLVLTFTSACKKFLTVNPKTEMSRDVLFSNETGFKDALAGVYIQLTEDAAYGKAMTMTTMEHLVSSWDVLANSTEAHLGLFNYGDSGAELALLRIYGQQYKIIASINAILHQIDAKKSVFNPGVYELIKSECLALRAYCHFDLIRLFGPVPTETGFGNRLPYVTVFSKVPNPAIDFDAFRMAIMKDLTDSESLVKEVDPFIENSILDFKNNSFNVNDDFVGYRYLRMNYYAVKALQARAYLWFNDYPKAYECAKAVIEAKDKSGEPKFRLGTAVDFNAKDYVLSCEHIFGLYDFGLYTKYRATFGSNLLKKGSDATIINNQLYGNTGTDIREADLWEGVTMSSISSYSLKKYQVEEAPSSLVLDFKQIPMLRISEMYLIAIESAGQAEADVLWSAFLSSRNLVNTALPVDQFQKQQILLKEYRKEFYAEGQAFFAYKRLDASRESILFAPVEAVVNYIPPMPKTEITTIN